MALGSAQRGAAAFWRMAQDMYGQELAPVEMWRGCPPCRFAPANTRRNLLLYGRNLSRPARSPSGWRRLWARARGRVADQIDPAWVPEELALVASMAAPIYLGVIRLK